VTRVSSRLAQAGLSALLVLLIAAHVAGVFHIASMQRAEAWLYDAWLMRTAPAGADDRVAILDIDEASLKSVGRWPWSRDTMTALVEQLFDRYGVAAVGFDVVFAEPDTSSGLDTLKQLAQRDLAGSRDFRAALEQLAPRLDYDARFAQALADRPVSLGYYFIPEGYGDATSGMLPAPSLPADAFDAAATRFAAANGLWRQSGRRSRRRRRAQVFQHARRRRRHGAPDGAGQPLRSRVITWRCRPPPCGWRSAAIEALAGVDRQAVLGPAVCLAVAGGGRHTRATECRRHGACAVSRRLAVSLRFGGRGAGGQDAAGAAGRPHRAGGVDRAGPGRPAG
jgi:hypothetical protein